MTGVEILSSEAFYNTFLPGWCLIVGIMLMFAFFVATFACLCENRNIIACICTVLAIGCMIFSGISCTKNKNSINYIEYKVTIDDSVSMNEFLDKYEILDQEGKIYTVKEKNTDK